MTARHRKMGILIILGLFSTLTACGRTPVTLTPNDAGPTDDAICDPSCATICAKTAIPCGLDSNQSACETRCAQDPMSPEFRCLRDLACQPSISCTLVRACPSAPRLTDLTIRSFTAVARNRAFIDYRIEVCNQGNQDANDIEIALYLARESAPRPNDIRDFLATIPSLARGQCHIIHTQLVTHRAAVTSWAFVDPNQQITEINETNNIAGPLAINLIPKAGPDLEIKSFDVYPDKDSVTFIAQVCNIGTQTTSGYTHIDFYENSVSPPSTSTSPDLSKLVPALAPTKCYEVKTRDPLSPGSYHAWAYINRTHAVAESSFANNLSKRRDFVIGSGNYPDLYIKTFDVYTWQKGATYVVTICNQGKGNVSSTAFEIFHQKTIPSQTSPAATTVSVPWIVAGSCESFKTTLSLNEGNYVAWAWINRRNKPVESNTKNNLAGPKTFTLGDPNKRVDLAITSMSASATPMGSTVYRLEVCNLGVISSPASSVSLFYNRVIPPQPWDTANLTKGIPILTPKACHTLSLTGTPTAGRNISWAAVDLAGYITESNETNNLKSLIVNVAPPKDSDLAIKSFKSQATSTGDTAYTVEVCNVGLAPTPASEVAIYYSLPTSPKMGTPGDQNLKVSSLPPGVCGVFVTNAILAPGPYLSWAFVDPQGLLKEMNETNNIAGPLSVSVGTPQTACDKACSALVSPCKLLPKGQLNACITNCQSLPQSKIDCAYKATLLGDCNAITTCLF